MGNNKVPVSLIRTNIDKIDTIPIVNGQLILVEEMNGDSAYIASDNKTGRVKYTDIVDLNSELEKDLITPSKNKFYYVKETNFLYRYIDNDWVCLNPKKNVVVQVDKVINLPSVGDPHTVYFIKSKNLTYYWNEDELHYYCAGSDWHDIETVDANFTLR